jgi:hypothetical protein
MYKGQSIQHKVQMWKKSSTDFLKSPQDKLSCKSVWWDPRWYVRRDEHMEERTDGHPDTVSGRTNILIQFGTKRALLWRFDVVDNNETNLGLHEKCTIFLTDFNQIWSFVSDFNKSLQYQMSRQQSSGNRADIWGQTDGQRNGRTWRK